MPECVPEPERRDQENEQKEVLPVVVIENSSEEDDDDYNHDLELQGYQPLPVADELNVSSDEEDDNEALSDNDDQKRKIEVDFDLVRHAMKNIKLDMKAIPVWAKEISDSDWKEVVQQTINAKDQPTVSTKADIESNSEVTPDVSSST